MAKKGWTDAEERIIAWAQLSGITAQDFVRIGARLRREERITERARAIERALTGVDIDICQRGWLVTIPHSQNFKFRSHTIKCCQFYIFRSGSYPSIYTVQVLDNSNLTFAQFKYTANRWSESQFPNRIYPERNKELFLVIRTVLRGGGLPWKDLKRPVKIVNKDLK